MGNIKRTKPDATLEEYDVALAELQRERNEMTWTMIKRRGIKTYLLENYCLDCKRAFGLTTAQTRRLFKRLNCRIVCNLLDTCDIEIKDGRIIAIEGIRQLL